MKATCPSEELLRLLPPIRRARLWRLYAEDGRRFLDLWMDGGRAMLGTKGTGIGTVVKAAVDVGLSKPMPSVREQRLEKEVLERHPGYAAVRFYRSEAGAREALARAFGASGLFDPARRDGASRGGEGRGEARAVLLRPFADALAEPGGPAAGDFPAAMPLFPCPAPYSPVALLFRELAAAELAASELVSPLCLAAASKALHELDRFSGSYNEELWRRTDRRLSAFFERSGPYLYAKTGPSGHSAFFRAALGAGVLVSPESGLPCLVPGDFDDGELAKLASALEAARA